MAMTKEQATSFINEELIPAVNVSSSRAFTTLAEDFDALVIALSSGNDILVFAMASYISNVDGLKNGVEIAQKITNKMFQ